MGQTITDSYRERYQNLRNHGLSHEEALEMWPKPLRERVQKALEMSDFESHFGSLKSFLITTGIILVITGILIYIGYKQGW